MRTQLRLSTPATCALPLAQIKELIAACHRHDVPEDATVAVVLTDRDGAPAEPYFSLVVTKEIEA